MNEIDKLNKRIADLEFRLNEFVRPDRYDFRKTLTTASGGKIGFFGITPVVKPTSTGEADGVSVGAGTALTHTATFTGDNGTTAYTLSDVVKHLKDLGLLLK